TTKRKTPNDLILLLRPLRNPASSAADICLLESLLRCEPAWSSSLLVRFGKHGPNRRRLTAEQTLAGHLFFETRLVIERHAADRQLVLGQNCRGLGPLGYVGNREAAMDLRL